MRLRDRRPNGVKTRRTTLTLPADSLSRAERIAHTRKVNLSTVISEALDQGLRTQEVAERAAAVLEAYKKAFAGFTGQERALLDGIVLEPVRNGRRG